VPRSPRATCSSNGNARFRNPGNNAPVWREVRKEGQEHYTSIKGRETGVLVQSAGETWRRIRNGPVTFWGGWLVVAVCALIAALYYTKGPIKLHGKPTGRLIHRFSSAEQSRTGAWGSASACSASRD
jgi:formate dehydrogenase subunit gamma